MKTLSTMMKTIILIALMLSVGLSTAQAKDRISYFHSDISGSPIAATNDSGEVLWEETYKPYGERLNTDNTNKTNNNQWYTGKQEEADLGLQYFGARWYHQASGRFISRDPAGVLAHVEDNPMMFNRYAYGNNNPYKYVDTDGRLPFLIPIAIFIAKEIASEAVEQVVGIPMPTVKNGLKYAIKQGNKQIAKEGMEQAAKVVKATSKKSAKGGGKGSNTPDFVVSPGGTAFPLPKGAKGLTPVVNPGGKTTGSAFTGGKGGANGQVGTMRIMNPTPARGKSPGYPNGYIKYENKAGQGVNPNTGRTISNKDSHFPID